MASRTSTADQELVRRMLMSALPHARTDSIERLVAAAHLRPVAARSLIFRRGQSEGIALVVEGHAALRRYTTEGRELILTIVRAGTLVGYSSIACLPMSVDLVALTPVRVAVWHGGGLRAMIADDPGLALDVIHDLGKAMTALTDRVDGFLYQDARQRVMRVLKQYGDLFLGDAAVLSRGYLAQVVGTSRQMTARVMRELERDGLLVRSGRRGLSLTAGALSAEEALPAARH